MSINLYDIRKSAVQEIESLLKKHNIDTLYISDIDIGSAPVIYSDLAGYDAASYILDKLYYSGSGDFMATISSCTEELDYPVDELPTDALYNILEFLEEREDELAGVNPISTDITRDELYNKISIALTDYENSQDTEEVNAGFLDEFYNLLVQIQNYWEDVITSDN